MYRGYQKKRSVVRPIFSATSSGLQDGLAFFLNQRYNLLLFVPSRPILLYANTNAWNLALMTPPDCGSLDACCLVLIFRSSQQ